MVDGLGDNVLWAEVRVMHCTAFGSSCLAFLQALLALQDTFLQRCYEKILMENLWICGHVVRNYSERQCSLHCKIFWGRWCPESILFCIR